MVPEEDRLVRLHGMDAGRGGRSCGADIRRVSDPVGLAVELKLRLLRDLIQPVRTLLPSPFALETEVDRVDSTRSRIRRESSEARRGFTSGDGISTTTFSLFRTGGGLGGGVGCCVCDSCGDRWLVEVVFEPLLGLETVECRGDPLRLETDS